MRYRYRILIAEWPLWAVAFLWAYLTVVVDDHLTRMIFIAGPQLAIFIAWRTWKRLMQIRDEAAREKRIAFVRDNPNLFIKTP
jgi:hypothetical protein